MSTTHLPLSFQLSLEDKDRNRAILCKWVTGFRRNSKTKPYLLTEALRLHLFPNAPPTSVVPERLSGPVLQKIQEHMEYLGDELDNINLDEMEDVSGKGSMVGDSPSVITINSNDSVSKSSTVSDTSFKGFTTKSKSQSISSLPSLSCKPKIKSTKKSAHKQDKSKTKSNSQGSSNKNPPQEPHKAPDMESKKDFEAMTASVFSQIRTELADVRSIRTELIGIRSSIKSDMADLATEMSSTVQTLEEKFDSKVNALANNLSDRKPGDSPSPDMPPTDSLPDFEPQNPWRSARYAPFSAGMLTIEGIGTRPISDFERYPPEGRLPYCFVRLSQEASVREDRVPKETVIYPRERAQTCLMQEMKEAECVNSRLLPYKGNLTMFQTHPDMPNPVATKVLEAVNQAILEDKPSTPLKEEESTSFLFPGDSPAWENVTQTFSNGKLQPDCASVQFNEDLPKIPDSLLKAEFETRTRLARTLHSFTLAEMSSIKYPDLDVFKVLSKSMVQSLRQDLADFALARRRCRKHVLRNAMIRHEPTKLINGIIWGINLFPNDLVRETIDAATSANQSLRTRWDLSFKRKSQEDSGPQPKNNPRKKQRPNYNYRFNKAQNQHSVMVSVPSSSHQAQLN